MTWTRPHTEGPGPTGRYGHSAQLMQGNKLIIFGGWGRGGCQSNDVIKKDNAHSLHVLDVERMIWHSPHRATKKTPRHVFNHGACVAGNTLLTFGGFDGRQSSSDVFVTQIDFNELF